MASWTWRSASFSSRSPALTNPTGAATTSSPRRAFSYRAERERWRSRSSSYSLRLPLRPKSSRSLPWRGAQTVSWSTSTVSTTRHISMSCCQSRLLRAKARDLSGRHRANLAEADLCHHRSKPARATPPAAERPRASSMTSIVDQPMRRAGPASHIVGRGSRDCAGLGGSKIAARKGSPCAPMLWPNLVRHHRPPPSVLDGDRRAPVVEDQTHHQRHHRTARLVGQCAPRWWIGARACRTEQIELLHWVAKITASRRRPRMGISLIRLPGVPSCAQNQRIR